MPTLTAVPAPPPGPGWTPETPGDGKAERPAHVCGRLQAGRVPPSLGSAYELLGTLGPSVSPPFLREVQWGQKGGAGCVMWVAAVGHGAESETGCSTAGHPTGAACP